MGTRHKERAKLLWLRKRVTLAEAPYLVVDKLGGMYDDAFALIFEAIKDKSLPADARPKNSWDLLNGEYVIDDTVDSFQTTLATADLLAWLEPFASADNIEPPTIQQPAPAELSKHPAPQINDVAPNAEANTDQTLAALFDPVTVEALEKMFPSAGKWGSWAERAARNGLSIARSGRGLFNPYHAAFWFLTQGIAGWDTARVNRTLANNLPARSRHDGHLLTGDIN